MSCSFLRLLRLVLDLGLSQTEHSAMFSFAMLLWQQRATTISFSSLLIYCNLKGVVNVNNIPFGELHGMRIQIHNLITLITTNRYILIELSDKGTIMINMYNVILAALTKHNKQTHSNIVSSSTSGVIDEVEWRFIAWVLYGDDPAWWFLLAPTWNKRYYDYEWY